MTLEPLSLGPSLWLLERKREHVRAGEFAGSLNLVVEHDV